ncbi:MAG: helix-turn-helix transcriptional regulator [Acidobacteriales bacterium]|nr:helix-turn-helix transcriptional regulator [Terriglobales bacterium]
MLVSTPEQPHCDSTTNRGWQGLKQVDEDQTNSASTKQKSQKQVANRAQNARECSAQFAITLIQGKWKTRILSQLQHGPTRLSQLRRMFPEASKKMLTQHLRELERDGLVVRIDLSSRLRHVEYSLSPLGLAALSLIEVLTNWGREYLRY